MGGKTLTQPGSTSRGHVTVETAERRALLVLTQILNASEEAASHPTDSTLDAQLNLAATTRRSLAHLATIMYKAGWITRGHLVAPNFEPVPVVLSMPGAQRLRLSASDVTHRVRTEVMHGELDGWLWSTATMQFIPDKHAPIRAAVPLGLQSDVARLNSQQERNATVTLEVLERQAPNGGAVSRTFALSSLSPDNVPTLLDDDLA